AGLVPPAFFPHADRRGDRGAAAVSAAGRRHKPPAGGGPRGGAGRGGGEPHRPHSLRGGHRFSTLSLARVLLAGVQRRRLLYHSWCDRAAVVVAAGAPRGEGLRALRPLVLS